MSFPQLPMFTFSIILLLLFGLKIEASGRSRRQPNIFNPENFLHCASGFCLPKVKVMFFTRTAYSFTCSSSTVIISSAICLP